MRSENRVERKLTSGVAIYLILAPCLQSVDCGASAEGYCALGTMNLYWVYALPNWLFGVLTVAVTVAIGLGGLWATRKWVLRIHGEEHSHNEVVGFYLGAVCLFYGITLGLLAVGTWQTYTEVETRVGEEAATAGGLYRDVSTLLIQAGRNYKRICADILAR